MMRSNGLHRLRHRIYQQIQKSGRDFLPLPVDYTGILSWISCLSMPRDQMPQRVQSLKHGIRR
ncbi:hypothetical protein DS742_25070 [Lacrimispora amygdalina]|uniref:Uncharacterized protein n=1 Tax=Lacrimispora amygdalina TaxID=253257 RepID=A0A3E2N5D1_9FIRM|nr:hypothetical protein DS742_25070 [Clostridium indicum]